MKTIFEKSNGANGIEFGECKLEGVISESLLRKDSINLPQLSELEVMRHYKELSDRNFCIAAPDILVASDMITLSSKCIGITEGESSVEE